MSSGRASICARVMHHLPYSLVVHPASGHQVQENQSSALHIVTRAPKGRLLLDLVCAYLLFDLVCNHQHRRLRSLFLIHKRVSYITHEGICDVQTCMTISHTSEFIWQEPITVFPQSPLCFPQLCLEHLLCWPIFVHNMECHRTVPVVTRHQC